MSHYRLDYIYTKILIKECLHGFCTRQSYVKRSETGRDSPVVTIHGNINFGDTKIIFI